MITFISAKFNRDNCLFDLDSPVVYEWVKGGLEYDTDYQIDRLNRVVFGRNAGVEKVIAYLSRSLPDSFTISRICFDIGFPNVSYSEFCKALTEAYAEYQKRSKPPTFEGFTMSLGSKTSRVSIKVKPALVGTLVEFGIKESLALKFWQEAEFDNLDFNLDQYCINFLEEISVYLFGMKDWFNTFDQYQTANKMVANLTDWR